MEQYFNDAIIGNKNMLASYTKKGELIRLFYPNTDYRQFIEYFYTGVKINDSGLVYLHKDTNNIYKQEYVEDTNILNTEIKNTYFNLKIIGQDFVCIKDNILIKRYKFINENDINLDINFVLHSKLLSNTNNDVSGYLKDNILIQYMHDYSMCTFSKMPITSAQINNTLDNIRNRNYTRERLYRNVIRF